MNLKLETLEDVRDWHNHLASISDFGTGAIIEAIADNNRKAAKIIDAHLSAQAKVQVTRDQIIAALNAKLPRGGKPVSAYIAATLQYHPHTIMETALEGARLSQGAQGEAVGEVRWMGNVPGSGMTEVLWKDGQEPPVGTKLYTHPAERAAVPDGWVLVPRQSTGAMNQAAADSNAAHGCIDCVDAQFLWDAMLTAAPQPPEGARVVPDGKIAEIIGAVACNGALSAWAIAEIKDMLAAPTLAGKEGA